MTLNLNVSHSSLEQWTLCSLLHLNSGLCFLPCCTFYAAQFVGCTMLPNSHSHWRWHALGAGPSRRSIALRSTGLCHAMQRNHNLATPGTHPSCILKPLCSSHWPLVIHHHWSGCFLPHLHCHQASHQLNDSHHLPEKVHCQVLHDVVPSTHLGLNTQTTSSPCSAVGALSKLSWLLFRVTGVKPPSLIFPCTHILRRIFSTISSLIGSECLLLRRPPPRSFKLLKQRRHTRSSSTRLPCSM